MKWLAASALIVATGVSSGPEAIPGVANAARAKQNWMLSCQGCHRADATGTAQTTPTMAGFVARFLHVPGGREYLVQVPGVATAALSDADLAEVVNWSLVRFDAANIPADFKPYAPGEVGRLRLKPLRAEAMTIRAGMVARFAPETTQQKQEQGRFFDDQANDDPSGGAPRRTPDAGPASGGHLCSGAGTGGRGRNCRRSRHRGNG